MLDPALCSLSSRATFPSARSRPRSGAARGQQQLLLKQSRRGQQGSQARAPCSTALTQTLPARPNGAVDTRPAPAGADNPVLSSLPARHSSFQLRRPAGPLDELLGRLRHRDCGGLLHRLTFHRHAAPVAKGKEVVEQPKEGQVREATAGRRSGRAGPRQPSLHRRGPAHLQHGAAPAAAPGQPPAQDSPPQLQHFAARDCVHGAAARHAGGCAALTLVYPPTQVPKEEVGAGPTCPG